MHGFTDIGQQSDHKIAAFLRKHGAINNFRHVGKSVQWFAGSEVILVAIYNRPQGTVSAYWANDRLAEEWSN